MADNQAQEMHKHLRQRNEADARLRHSWRLQAKVSVYRLPGHPAADSESCIPLARQARRRNEMTARGRSCRFRKLMPPGDIHEGRLQRGRVASSGWGRASHRHAPRPSTSPHGRTDGRRSRPSGMGWVVALLLRGREPASAFDADAQHGPGRVVAAAVAG